MKLHEGRDANNWRAMAEQFASRGMSDRAAECLAVVAKLEGAK